MIIKSGLTGVTSYENNAIEKPIGAIMFVFNFAASFVVSLGATLQSVFNASTVNLSLVTKNGNDERLWSSYNLHDLVEWAVNQEGMVRYDHTGTRIEKVTAIVPICPDGALAMSNDESFRLRLEGLSTDAGVTIDIEGVESHIRDYEVFKHHNLYVPDGTLEKQFNIKKFSQLVLPLDSNLQDIQVSYPNGITVEQSLNLMKGIQSANNDLVWADTNGDVKAGYERLYVYDCTGALSVDVRLASGSYSFVGVSAVSGVNEEEAFQTNDKIVDTTVQARRASQMAVKKA